MINICLKEKKIILSEASTLITASSIIIMKKLRESKLEKRFASGVMIIVKGKT